MNLRAREGNGVMKRKMCLLMTFIPILYTGFVMPPLQVSTYVQRNSLVGLGFSLCSQAPCFLTVIPGKTTWQEARSVLLTNDFKDLSYWVISREQPIQGGIYIARVPDNPDLVNSVELSDLSQNYHIMLDDVLDLYGLPCSVGSDFKGSFWFAYPNMLVNALSTERSSAQASVIFLELQDPNLAISVSGFNVCEHVEYSTEYLLWFTAVI
jgi:hypothetical protein